MTSKTISSHHRQVSEVKSVNIVQLVKLVI